MLKSITEQNKECNAGLYEDAKHTHCKDWGCNKCIYAIW